jgi:2-polyprenyl-6-methoxyphenol hydroxylase-like FAD-dependent oxidoreductase
MTLAQVPRYDRGRVADVGRRAVVLGGSLAGLCAARVLADGFEEVVVLERDSFPAEPAARDGAPQTSHPHALLEAGRATLEDLCPGFGETLLSEGALLLDASTQVGHYEEGGFLADGPERLPMYCASRPLFEDVVRRQVRSREAVRLRGGCRVTGYRLGDAGTTVTGVELRDSDGAAEALAADLVVDATGRTSRTPGWLDDRGYAAPPVDEVTVDVTYSSIRVERPADDRRCFLVPPSAPRTRGIFLIPVENGQWQVLLQGVHGDDAPTDAGRFREFARGMPVDELGRLVEDQPWVSGEINHYPFPSSIRRRYWDLERFPDGLVVTGDAVASFNPVYGQGMSVAALDALLLHHALAEGGLEDLPGRFFERVRDVVDVVWQIAVGSDFEFPQTTGPRPRGTELFGRYLSRLVRQAHTDPVVSDAFARVLLLEHPPTRLLRPHVAWRVLGPTGGAADATVTPAED